VLEYIQGIFYPVVFVHIKKDIVVISDKLCRVINCSFILIKICNVNRVILLMYQYPYFRCFLKNKLRLEARFKQI